MSSDLISKALLSVFTVGYVFTYGKSLLRREIFFMQGRGVRLSENRMRFILFALYHGTIVLTFSSISIGAWIFL